MMMDELIRKLERTLHHDVPLTRAMGVRVARYDGTSLTLEAPLENNRNHKSTAFGGSLYSLAALSGWGLLQLKLQEHALKGHIVIYEGRVSYRNPVMQKITARCALPDEESFTRSLRMYARKGMTRIQLLAEIPGPIGTAVSFHGTYVIHN